MIAHSTAEIETTVTTTQQQCNAFTAPFVNTSLQDSHSMRSAGQMTYAAVPINAIQPQQMNSTRKSRHKTWNKFDGAQLARNQQCRSHCGPYSEGINSMIQDSDNDFPGVINSARQQQNRQQSTKHQELLVWKRNESIHHNTMYLYRIRVNNARHTCFYKRNRTQQR